VLLIRQAVTDGNPRTAFRWGWCTARQQRIRALLDDRRPVHFTRSRRSLSRLDCRARLLTGVMFWFVVRLRLSAPAVPLLLVLPVAWTALEWLIRASRDVRFPWLGLGTSLADAPVLVQWADIAGPAASRCGWRWCNVAIVEAATEVRGTRTR